MCNDYDDDDDYGGEFGSRVHPQRWTKMYGTFHNSPNNRVREISQANANALAMMINFCVFNLKLLKRQNEEGVERSLFLPF